MIKSSATPPQVLEDIADLKSDNADDLSAITVDSNFSGNGTPASPLTLADDVTIVNLTVNGTTTTVNAENLLIQDNVIVINSGETGAGVTLGSAGIIVDRGTETDYNIVFDESDDVFKIGEVGSEQAVATRDASVSMSNAAFARWDGTNYKFVTIVPFEIVSDGRALALTDIGKTILSSKATAATFTVPKNATTAIPINAQFAISQVGAGQVSIAGEDASVTINGGTSTIDLTNGQYKTAAYLVKTAENTWYVIGSIQ